MMKFKTPLRAINCRVGPGRDFYVDVFTWPQDDARIELQFLCSSHSPLKFDILQNRNKRYLQLQEGHSCTNALPGTHSKRHVRKGWALLGLLWKKTVWIELFWL